MKKLFFLLCIITTSVFSQSLPRKGAMERLTADTVKTYREIFTHTGDTTRVNIVRPNALKTPVVDLTLPDTSGTLALRSDLASRLPVGAIESGWIQDHNNPIGVGGEVSFAENGTSVDAWVRYGYGASLTDNYIAYRYATNDEVTNWSTAQVCFVGADTLRGLYPFALKYGTTYYLWLTKEFVDTNLYMYSSTDKIHWTAANSGNPVFHHSPTFSSQYHNIWNPAVAIVNDTIHILMEGSSGADHTKWLFYYSWSTLASPNFDANVSASPVIEGPLGVSTPDIKYIPERRAFLATYVYAYDRDPGIQFGAWELRASSALLSSNLGLAASWVPCPSFPRIYDHNIDISDQYMVELPNHPLRKMLIGYAYSQGYFCQAYSNVTMLQLYDYSIQKSNDRGLKGLQINGQLSSIRLRLSGRADIGDTLHVSGPAVFDTTINGQTIADTVKLRRNLKFTATGSDVGIAWGANGLPFGTDGYHPVIYSNGNYLALASEWGYPLYLNYGLTHANSFVDFFNGKARILKDGNAWFTDTGNADAFSLRVNHDGTGGAAGLSFNNADGTIQRSLFYYLAGDNTFHMLHNGNSIFTVNEDGTTNFTYNMGVKKTTYPTGVGDVGIGWGGFTSSNPFIVSSGAALQMQSASGSKLYINYGLGTGSDVDIFSGNILFHPNGTAAFLDNGSGAGVGVRASDDATGAAGISFLSNNGSSTKSAIYWLASDNSFNILHNGSVALKIPSTGNITFTGLALTGLTASAIVETDASKNLISSTKNTGYNLALGNTAGTVAEGNHGHNASEITESVRWFGSLASPPSTPSEGWMYWDTTADKLQVYTNGAWRP